MYYKSGEKTALIVSFQGLDGKVKAGPPLDLSFWSFVTERRLV